MRELIIIILLMIQFPVWGSTLANGLYEASQEKTISAIFVQSADGSEINIGKKVHYKILMPYTYLSSVNNQNNLFHLSIQIPYNKKHKDKAHVLVVAGIAYKQNGYGSSENKYFNINFMINGKDKAKSVARFLKIKPRYRQHPGHLLIVDFVPVKKEYHKNEEVWVTFKIKNVGKTTICFQVGGMNRAPRDNQYVFHAYVNGKQVEDIGSTNHFGGLSINQNLKPQEVFEKKISLSKWFQFKQPGFYSIIGSYHMTYYNPNDQKDYHIQWEDLLTAKFYFQVK